MNRGLIAIFLVALIAAGAGCGGGGGSVAPQPAQASADRGKIEGYAFTPVAGRVSESSAVRMPLSQVNVSCAGVNATTDTQGFFALENVPVGKQTCSLSKQGYLVRQFAVEVVAGKTTKVSPDGLSPEESGSLLVKSTPSGAAILIDGLEVAATSTAALLDQVLAAKHEISVTIPGYETASANIEIASNNTSSIEFTLDRLTTSITAPWDNEPVTAGSEKQLSATCGYSDGSSADCARRLEWKSSDPAVAAVSAEGKLTALSPGSTVITASREKSKISFPGITVTVACPSGKSWQNGSCSGDILKSIAISPASTTIQAGNSTQLEASCEWATAGAAPCPALDWRSSNESAATVSASGAVEAVSPGAASITAVASGITSNAAAISVPENLYPEPTCEGATDFCIDISRGMAGPDGTVSFAIKAQNLPPGGIRGCAITIAWDSQWGDYFSRTTGSGVVVQAENSSVAGRYKLALTFPSPRSQDSTLATLILKFKDGSPSPQQVSWGREIEETNFTDAYFNLVSTGAVSFKDAWSVFSTNPI